MDGYKDFQGKTLDDAIREATAYFDVAREKLEIDIVQDAKSGVFGLIGARKAKVRARRVQLKNTVDELVGRGRDLRASFREEFESNTSVHDAEDAFEGNAQRERRDDNRREDKRRDSRDGRREENQDGRADSRSDNRQDEGRERSARRGRPDRQDKQDKQDRQERPERQERSERQDRQTRGERQDASQFDERSEERRDDRRSEGEERRSNSRRQRNERSDRQERSERVTGDRPERNQERSRRSDRNQERNQNRPTQERQDAMQSEGNFEPMEDENGVLMDAESRERSSRRRRRGRGRSRSRTDANGAESNALDASLENGDSQEAVDFAEAPASEMDANLEAPRRNQDGRRNNRRDNDGRRSSDRRANGNRRENDRRDSERRDGDSRRDNESRRGDRRSNSERNERPYRNSDASSQAPSDFDAENEYAQANQLMDDQAYDRPEGLPDIPLESLDQELVRSVALEVTERLVFPIIGPADLTVEATDGRVKIGIDCGDNSGLLIGREGQTLASIQYLASRIIARKLGAAVRVQLDTGDYRERQDEKLRELALSFAERVRATGRPQSTRPLSSYHRRVVHLVLQDDEDIVTRSKGEGPLKRVIILRRRKNSAE